MYRVNELDGNAYGLPFFLEVRARLHAQFSLLAEDNI